MINLIGLFNINKHDGIDIIGSRVIVVIFKNDTPKSHRPY